MTRPMQKARAGMRVDDERMALYTAARAFFWGQWAGALVITASYAQFTFAILSPAYGTRPGLFVGIGLLALGAWMYLASRRYWTRLAISWRRRGVQAALVFAWSGPVYWGMFVVAALLWWAGVPLY